MIKTQIRLERDLSHNYMVPMLKAQYSKDDYQIHMLQENTIPGLLTMKVHHMDGMTEYYYDITNRESMEQKYQNMFLTEEDIVQILKSLFEVVNELEKYLLDANCILLTPASIYMDKESGMPGFCYLPGYGGKIEDAFCSFSEHILRHLNQNDQKAVFLGYEIYRQAVQKNDSLKTVLKHAFETKNENSAKVTVKEEMAVPQMELAESEEHRKETVKHLKAETVKEVRKENRKDYKNESNRGKKRQSKIVLIAIIAGMLLGLLIVMMKMGILTTTQGGGIAFLAVGVFGFILSEKKEPAEKNNKLMTEDSVKDFGATTVLWEGEEEYKPSLSLIGMNSRDRQTIILKKDSYLIGKQKSKVDICVNDPAISRIHARIVKEGEDFYLSDMNSTNGTFHNGRRLLNGEKVKLELTDEVTFAESGFYLGNC